MLFVAVLMVSLVYGFMYGNYRTMVDVVGSASSLVKGYVPALLAMLPASGLMPCLHYTGMDVMIGFDGNSAPVIETVVYILPFIYVAVLRLLRKG